MPILNSMQAPGPFVFHSLSAIRLPGLFLVSFQWACLHSSPFFFTYVSLSRIVPLLQCSRSSAAQHLLFSLFSLAFFLGSIPLSFWVSWEAFPGYALIELGLLLGYEPGGRPLRHRWRRGRGRGFLFKSKKAGWVQGWLRRHEHEDEHRDEA